MLTVRRLARIALDAFIMAVVVLSVVWLSSRRWGWGSETTRSALMLTLLASHLVLVLVVRAERRSLEPGWSRVAVVVWAIAGSAALQGAVYSLAPMRSLLGLRPVPPIAWVLSLVAAAITMVLLDAAGSLERHLARFTTSRRTSSALRYVE
jgi:hypothetical protein